MHNIRFSGQSNDELDLLFLTDLHWDNPKCKRDILKRDLEDAKQRGSPIFIFGDLFCCMQGKYDKRSNKDMVREEHQTGNYLDALVKTAADWFEPYKHQLAVIAPGNHETSVLERHETNLCERLVARLRDRGSDVHLGGYGGWVRILTARDNERRTFRMFYHHGFGGGGPITRGAIDWSRYLMQAEADVFVAGHIHYRNKDTLTRATVTDQGVVRKRDVHFLRCGTYKDEYDDGAEGWHIEKGRGPRPIGGWWMTVILGNGSRQTRLRFVET